MGTLRTIIGLWFQFWGGILMIVGIVFLIFGGSALSFPTFDFIGSLPLTSLASTTPMFLEPNSSNGCLVGYIFNPSVDLCQRIGSDTPPPEEISGVSLSSIAGFGGLIYLGFGIFEFLIGTVIRGK